MSSASVDLLLAGAAAALPLCLQLPDGSELVLERALRCIPGKRWIGAARWADKPVLARLYAPAGRRQLRRELNGIAALRAAGLPGPELLLQLEWATATLVLHRWLPAARPVFDGLQPPGDLTALFDLLASGYAAGVLQTDLHSGNFLCSEERLRMLDAAGIAPLPGGSRRRAAVAQNLGLLVAQFALPFQPPVVAQLLAHAIADWLGPQAQVQLAAAVASQWQQRRLRSRRKALRPHSRQVCGAAPGGRRFFAVAAALRPQLMARLQQPTEPNPGIEELDGELVLVQSLAWRPSWWRQPVALDCWQLLQWLPWLGVAALPPLALLLPQARWQAGAARLFSTLPAGAQPLAADCAVLPAAVTGWLDGLASEGLALPAPADQAIWVRGPEAWLARWWS